MTVTVGLRRRFTAFCDLAFVSNHTSPSITAYHIATRCGVPVADTVANVVVIAYRIEGLALRIVFAAHQELRIEELLLGIGVDVQLVGERPPYRVERLGGHGPSGLQVVQAGELLAEAAVADVGERVRRAIGAIEEVLAGVEDAEEVE